MVLQKSLSKSSLWKFVGPDGQDDPKTFYENFMGQKKISTQSLRKGSLLDVYVTDNANFGKKYAVFNGEFPKTELQLKFCEACAAAQDLNTDTIDAIYKDIYKTGKSMDLYNKYEDFISVSRNNHEKTLISFAELDSVKKQAEAIMSNPTAKDLLLGGGGTFQVKLEGELCGLPFLGYADRIKIEGNKITIVDLKTTSSDDFAESYCRYGYHAQMAVYHDLALDYAKYLGIENPQVETKLVIVNTVNNRCYVPEDFNGEKYIELGRYGGTLETFKGPIKVRGYIEVTERLKWHIENDLWDHPQEYYTHGTVKLNTNPIPNAKS